MLRNLKVKLSQNQIKALADLEFNIGEGKFAGSTLVRKLNAGDYAEAAEQFHRWNKVMQDGHLVANQTLSDRRAAKAQLFRTPDNKSLNFQTTINVDGSDSPKETGREVAVSEIVSMAIWCGTSEERINEEPVSEIQHSAVASRAAAAPVSQGGQMTAIIKAAAVRAMDNKSGNKIALLAGSEKFKRQFELIDALPNDSFSEFLDMLEDGVPEEFRHMLQSGGH